MGLIPAQGNTDVPTYHGYNGSESRIDYVMLHKDSCISFGLKPVYVKILKHICKDDNPDILSTHDALLFEIEIPSQMKNETTQRILPEVKVIETKKLLWE